jgi:glutamate-1-semialdehyde 2,1-aminomutase
MLTSGIFLPPSQFETNFLSAVHEGTDVEAIGQAYRECL